MEHTSVEAAIVEDVIAAAAGEQSRSLSELQLAFFGGGLADVIAA
jgi:hypothetical protein